MASLIVDHIYCLEETDEFGSDDLYMVVFRGNTIAPFDSNVAVYGPGNFWDDFDTGEDWAQDIPIAKYRTDAVYVVMVVEKDNDRDVNGPQVVGAYKAATSLTWKAQMLSLLGGGSGPATESQRATAANAIINTLQGLSSVYMEFPKGNDEIIGKPQRIKVPPTGGASYFFIGDGGFYQVNFKVA